MFEIIFAAQPTCRHAVSVCPSCCLSRSRIVNNKPLWQYSDTDPPLSRATRSLAARCFVSLKILPKVCHSRSLKMVPFESSGAVSYSHSRKSYYGSTLYHFRDKASYWPKIAIFSYPLHSTPPSTRRNIISYIYLIDTHLALQKRAVW